MPQPPREPVSSPSRGAATPAETSAVQPGGRRRWRPTPLAEARAVAVLLGVAGLLLGVLGAFLTPLTVAVLGADVSVGCLVALLNLPLGGYGGWATRTRLAAVAPVFGWGVAVAVLVVHGGDVVLGPQNALAPWLFLALGSAAGVGGAWIGGRFVPPHGG